MNTELMFSSKSDLWETPQDLFDELDKEFHFNLDVCALPENTKCAAYYTPEIDGLSQPWYGRCWCNPPYGRGVGAWVQKAARSALAGPQWLCCCQRGRIPDGSTGGFTAGPRSGFCREG